MQKHKEVDELLAETTKRWLIPVSKVQVTASGFDIKTKERIKESVEKLGGTFNFDLNSTITVLITKDNFSEKYNIAREMGIHTVTSQWLKESLSNDYFLNPENYIFPIFYNQKFNFYDCETKALVDDVREYRAEVVVDVDSSMTKRLIIVIPNNDVKNYVQELRTEYSFFTKAFEENVLKVVTVPWINAFINKKYNVLSAYTVKPEDYEEKVESSSPNNDRKANERAIENSKTSIEETKVLQKFIKKQEQDIEEHIGKLRSEADFRKNFFLMDANITLHNVHDKEDRILINRLVNVCGAFIYDSFVPGVTTHIVTQHPDKDLIGKAGSLDNTTGPYVVTKQWLIDSILNSAREDEKLYLPVNISQVHNSCSIEHTILKKRQSQNLRGTLFKGISFSIVGDSYSEEEVEEITEKIEANGGSVVSEYVENSVAKYLIMNDGHSDWKGFSLERNDEGKYIISHRFLDHCLNHKALVNLKKQKAMDLLPLPFTPPYPNFGGICVAFTLFPNTKDKEVLQNLAFLMGMNVQFTDGLTSHLIVNSEKQHQIKKSDKINVIKRSFKDQPKVVLFEWFLQ